MIKAVYFDIDGTLIPFGQSQMPPDTKQALNKLQQKGIKVFICTGRVPPLNLPGIQNFNFDGYVTSNGQYIYLNDGTIISKQVFSRESLSHLFDYIEKENIPLTVASLSGSFRNNSQYDAHLPIKNPKTLLDLEIVQLMAFIPPEKDVDFLTHIPEAKSARWTSIFADIIPITGGKNVGIEKMNRFFGYSLDEVMCFGDGGNDISMLRAIPHSIAMGNATDEVKAAASYTTDACDHQGISKALIHFGLIESF